MSESAYVSWASNKERDKAFEIYADALQENSLASYSNYRRDFSNLTPELGSYPGLSHSDYDWFRPNERVPTKPKEIISFARYSYRRIGLIRNSIDLMGDFACQGIRLAHRNSTVEQFYNHWFDSVNGKRVSERLCNLLFREANSVIKMKTAKINAQKRLDMQRAMASPDMQIEKNAYFSKGEIPWQYNFIDNLLVDVVGGALSSLTNKPQYYIKVPPTASLELTKLISSTDSSVQKVLNEIPIELKRAMTEQKPILLDQDKTYVYHYKKDDWQAWADPMTYACFRDLILYEKLKLADQAALDGATNKIRVWKLGSLDHKLAPTATASAVLNKLLSAHVGGGSKDIIWGPDIELIETSSDVQSFLGEEKYRPTLMAIYASLGIPPTLTGTFGASGTTNNFISLKTLTERLNYVRGIVLDFWNEQIKIVQKAMGFRYPATVEFDFMMLDDPTSILNLLISMTDRNILSDEFVQRFVKANPEIENRRVQKENNRKEEKISPFHQADQDFHLKKITLQTGVTSPSEVGLELEEKKDGEKSMMDMRGEQQKEQLSFRQQDSKTGTPGRPKNSNDTKPRQSRTFKPALKASIEIWAKEAQDTISKLLNPGILESFSKANMRSLSSEEFSQSEEMKFSILMNIEPFTDITLDSIDKTFVTSKTIHKNNECKLWIDEASLSLGRRLSVDETRNIRASFYANYYVSD